MSGVVRMLGVNLGPDEVLLTLGLRFDPGLDSDDLVAAVERIEARIRERDPRVSRIFVEPESPSDAGGLAPPY